MAIVLSNNAASILSAGISALSTTISLKPGTGSKFPILAAGDWCPITVVSSAGGIEIMKCTGRSGDVLTVERAQEGTYAQSFDPGARVEQRLTAKVIADVIADVSSRLPIAGGAVTGALSVAGSLTASILNGGTPWTSANFTPGSKFNVSGGTFSGPVSTVGQNVAMAVNDANAPLQVQNGTGTGDSNMAMMSFVCQGSYGVKVGLRADGYFGIGGWSAATWRWYLNNGTGDMVAAGNVAAYSDPRLKTDVARIRDALGIIEQLDGVRFTWNGVTQLVGKAGQRDIGVLADQVETVLPELVGRSIPDEQNGGTRWRVVAYDKLAPVLIEAVKELAERVKELEARP